VKGERTARAERRKPTESEIFCCGREISDAKGIEVQTAGMQVGEEKGRCARTLESWDELLAMERQTAVRQSICQQSWPRLEAAMVKAP
jgi:predicted NUDIX family NTP pyrophosphohydrolase